MSKRILYSAPASNSNSKLAEVAQHGQRRRTEAPIPQGFVGSNPTLRTILPIRGLPELIPSNKAYLMLIYLSHLNMIH